MNFSSIKGKKRGFPAAMSFRPTGHWPELIPMTPWLQGSLGNAVPSYMGAFITKKEGAMEYRDRYLVVSAMLGPRVAPIFSGNRIGEMAPGLTLELSSDSGGGMEMREHWEESPGMSHRGQATLRASMCSHPESDWEYMLCLQGFFPSDVF